MRRRQIFAAVLLLAAAGASHPASADVFDVRQGTNLSLATDPGGQFLVFDLLGGLWRLPITGGGAQVLIPAGSGIAQPRFDPSGQRIVFQRWTDGQWDIWQLDLADGSYVPLTDTPFNEREPDYSPDGRRVVFSADIDGSYQIWALELPTDTLRQLSNEAGGAHFPTFASSGELVFATNSGAGSTLNQYVRALQSVQLIGSNDRRLSAPSFRPGGGVLVYNERLEGQTSDLGLFIEADEPIRRRLTGREDVFVGRVAWISPAEYLYAADGQLWRRGIGSTERSQIPLIAGASVDSAPPPALEQPLDAAGPFPVTGINGLVRYEPDQRLAFSALGDLWLADGDRLQRLTDDAALDGWPEFSPDGDWLFFASDRGGDMQIWRIEFVTGRLQQVTAESGSNYLPRVSADGRFVAYLNTRGSGPWDAASLKLTRLDTLLQADTLATDLYDARDLAWRGSRVRLLAQDQAAHEPVPRVFETPADDIVPAAPERALSPAQLPNLPVWQPAAAAEPYVIQAERVFDGLGASYSYFVDIHIDGQRITDIVRRGGLPLPARVIDASGLTVLPGLIDVHAHHSAIAGSALGRKWLGAGVTTVHEAMANTREAIERAESWDSGRMPGPRLVISPASPPVDLALPPGSPLMLGGNAVARGLSHDLALQTLRADESLGSAPPILAVTDLTSEPMFEISTLGRSYGDIVAQLRASGAWLPSSLGAVEASALGRSATVTATIERVIRSTGRVAIGSDAPAVPYGSGFHRELALLAARDVPNDEILRWATAGGALALGLSLETGTLQRGRLADLILVDGDPLDDIEELTRIQAVVRGGIWFWASEL